MLWRIRIGWASGAKWLGQATRELPIEPSSCSAFPTSPPSSSPSTSTMNYLRGAVNAISAPYQYYKDLNPSTLTGAIDVIVVRRPKDLPDNPPEGTVPQLTDEDSEFVCSPFHVRFGKWQVLRPQDKKVRIYSPLSFGVAQNTPSSRSMFSSTDDSSPSQ